MVGEMTKMPLVTSGRSPFQGIRMD